MELHGNKKSEQDGINQTRARAVTAVEADKTNSGGKKAQ